MITFEQAIEIVLEHSPQGTATMELPIAKAAGHVLAEDIRSDIDMPVFNRAAMDGFAFRHADHARAEAFRIAGSIAAGELSRVRLRSGECVKIMTGAPVPDDADTVIPVEDTSAFRDPGAGTVTQDSTDDGSGGRAVGDRAPGGRAAGGRAPARGNPFAADSDPGDTVRFQRMPPPGANIAKKAEDLRNGQTVLRQGHLLRSQEVAILAAVGRPVVRVYRGPSIAFGATGEEIVDPGEPLPPGKIRNSNGYSLWSQVLQAKAEPHYLGIIADNEEELRRTIAAGLEHDMLILSGGVSMGEYDFVRQILVESGVEIRFHRLRVRPGRPMLFGTRDGTLVFGLPGNPISTLYAFDQYVAPAIRVFRRHPQPLATQFQGKLTKSLRKPTDWLAFVACVSEWRDGGYRLTPIRTHGSADIFAIAHADAIALIPAGISGMEQGETVSFRKMYEL
jgi:molybdopterin molybdotransferase